ncbi:MAG: hypothetical protein H7832_15530 [Magnetococcus sp. DMHC-6]
MHRFLFCIAQEGLQLWTPSYVRRRRPAIAAHLSSLGLTGVTLDQAVDRVEEGVLRVLSDPRGRWLLSPHSQEKGAEAHSEFSLTAIIESKFVRVVMDRVFVDERGWRWIVDFKTSLHTGSDLASFMDNEQLRYQEQMARYGQLMQLWDPERPIHLGLYFPMFSGWREWEMIKA